MMKILDAIGYILKRHRKTEKLRKQMKMTRKSSSEQDKLLGLIGLDYSEIKLCPVPVKTSDKNDCCRENGGRK